MEMKKAFLVISIFTLFASTLACSLSSLIGPHLTVTLAPESGYTWDEASMAQARDVILSRLKAIGVIGATTSVSSNRNLQIDLPTNTNMELVSPLLIEIGEITFVDSIVPVNVGETITNDLPVIFTNSDIDSASVIQDSAGNYMIAIGFTPIGTQKMAEYSSKNVGHYLMIVSDGVVINAPHIDSAITDGRAIINGSFTQDTAAMFAAQLRTKSLPFPLIIVETTTK
jgi:hypothetical protein